MPNTKTPDYKNKTLNEKATKLKDVLDVLLSKGWMIKPQVDHIRQESQATGKSISQILEDSQLVNEDKLLSAYADFFNLPIIKLAGLYIPPQVISRVPERLARKYYILAFDQKDNVIKVAIAKPGRLQAEKPGILTDVQKKQKVDVDLYLCSEKDFREALKYYHLKPKPEPKKKVKKKPLFQFKKKPPKPKESSKVEKPKELSKTSEVPMPTILDILVSQKQLNQKEAFKVFEESKKSSKTIEQIIREKGIVPPDELAKVQAQQYRLPYISLRKVKIKTEDVKRFPQNIAQEYKIVVFDVISDKVFKVATSVPENPIISEILDFLKEKHDIESYLYVTTSQDIELVLDKYKEVEVSKKAAEKLFPTKSKELTPEEAGELDIGTLIKKDIETVEELKKITKTEDVPKIVAAIINFALVKKASDIHIEPWKNNLHIRYRVDGVLKDVVKIDKKLHPAIIARVKISARLRIDEQRIPQDGRFDVNFRKRTVDIRVSTLPTSHGEKVVMRLLDKTKGVISLEDLGLTGKGFKVVVDNVKKPYGMILASGPTGSGKTTTLYAILQFINTSQTNIITLEDPIEYELEGINHCQVRSDIGFSFAQGLRNILRQDPNVIMIGEIRDKDTAGMAIHAALTGHLVLSSLHTNDAAGAIPRLVDMKIEPFLIASSVSVIIAQRLVRKICEKCKEKVSLPPEVLEKVESELKKIPNSAGNQIKKSLTFWRGRGCSECDDGYSDRIGIFEVLPNTVEIQQLATQQSSSGKIREEAIQQGMITMKQDGILKALQGITTIDEVFRATLIEK